MSRPGDELMAPSLVDLSVERLTREILSGRVEPGERLVEEQLTRRYGISRAPLREALRLLAQRGLVEHVPRRGTRVATLSERDVRELYALRDVLERHVVRTALPADPDALAEPAAALDAMRRATDAGDRLTLAESHRRFHVALVAVGGNAQLTRAYAATLEKIQLFMAVNLRREAETAAARHGVGRHERLFAALAAGDPDAVFAALDGHGARSYLHEG